MDHLDPTTAEEIRKSESFLCAISGTSFGKESVLMTLVSKKPVALSVGIINVDQRVVESALVKDKNKNNTSTSIHNTNEDISFCVQVENNVMSPTTDNADKKGSKSSEASPREEVQTLSIVYNTEGRMNSEYLHDSCDEIRNLKSKGSDIDSSYNKIIFKDRGNM